MYNGTPAGWSTLMACCCDRFMIHRFLIISTINRSVTNANIIPTQLSNLIKVLNENSRKSLKITQKIKLKNINCLNNFSFSVKFSCNLSTKKIKSVFQAWMNRKTLVRHRSLCLLRTIHSQRFSVLQRKKDYSYCLLVVQQRNYEKMDGKMITSEYSIE